MDINKRKTRKDIMLAFVSVLLSLLMVLSLASCGASDKKEPEGTASTVSKEDVKNPENVEDLKIDNTKWQYDEDNDVYYQIGVSYVTDAEDEDVEKLAIYVPGAYITAKDNGDGTYTCEMNSKKKVNGYTAETAPVVMPVNTPGYAEQSAATEYSYNDIEKYMKAGYIYVLAGCRGRSMQMGESSGSGDAETGAPWGVTDIKAAIRYLRYNKGSIAGDTDKIFVFGHSGGGAQSSVLGSSGDSSLYYSYLEKIGAAMTDDDGNYISDAVSGVMAWCPITNLDTANEAYEWMMGQYTSDGTRSEDTWTGALSDDMASAYAEYINSLGLTDEDGEELTLTESKDGIYTSGTYYEYLKETIEGSLSNFIKDTEFPYTSGGNSEMAGMGQGGPGAGSGERPSRGDLDRDSSDREGSGSMGCMAGNGPQGGQQEGSETYKTVEDYISALNEDGEWIKYDEKTGKVTITSVEDFVQHCKNASKDVGAFDSTDGSATENQVFSTGDSDGLHFDETMAKLLSENSSDYSKYDDYDESAADSAEADLEEKDSVGNTVLTRSNMYNPMYYLNDTYEGSGSSTVAKYWRINTGIEQGDTSLTTEMNLALALKGNENVEDVDFTTVWEQGHTMAERTGDGTTNFIEWVDECCK